ncbi:hypothetical protein LIA77_04369 [Sarocladium implicatum]|nr:hypothetical protein LIA77_04369 [Sarocladium implicatum]
MPSEERQVEEIDTVEPHLLTTFGSQNKRRVLQRGRQFVSYIFKSVTYSHIHDHTIPYQATKKDMQTYHSTALDATAIPVGIQGKEPVEWLNLEPGNHPQAKDARLSPTGTGTLTGCYPIHLMRRASPFQSKLRKHDQLKRNNLILGFMPTFWGLHNSFSRLCTIKCSSVETAARFFSKPN